MLPLLPMVDRPMRINNLTVLWELIKHLAERVHSHLMMEVLPLITIDSKLLIKRLTPNLRTE